MGHSHAAHRRTGIGRGLFLLALLGLPGGCGSNVDGYRKTLVTVGATTVAVGGLVAAGGCTKLGEEDDLFICSDTVEPYDPDQGSHAGYMIMGAGGAIIGAGVLSGWIDD